MYPKLKLSRDALKRAEKITLRDLLEAGITQSWIVSAMGNTVRFADQFEGIDTHEEMRLSHELNNVYRVISVDDRHACFDAAREIIKEARLQNRAQRADRTIKDRKVQ